MHDQGVRLHLSHETLVNMCVSDLAKKFPGKSLLTISLPAKIFST